MKKVDINFWPNTSIQWFRVIISVIGIVICVVYLFKAIEFDFFVGIITVLGFFGYLIESLNTNIEERKINK